MESISTRGESVSTRVESHVIPIGHLSMSRDYEISRVWDKEKIASQFSIGIPIGTVVLSTRVEILSTRVEIEEKNQNVSLKSCNTQEKYKLL